MASRTGLAICFAALVFAAILHAAGVDAQGFLMTSKDWNAEMVDKLHCPKDAYAMEGEIARYAMLKLTACVADRLDRLEARVQALEKAKRK